MKNIEDFVENMVKIEFIEDSNCYGHYPFSMFVETKDSKLEIISLALGGNVAACYESFKKYLKQDAKRIYLALDFPKSNDMPTDFVCVLTFEHGTYNAFAIPYNTDGTTLPIIKESNLLNIIFKEFRIVTQ